MNKNVAFPFLTDIHWKSLQDKFTIWDKLINVHIFAEKKICIYSYFFLQVSRSRVQRQASADKPNSFQPEPLYRLSENCRPCEWTRIALIPAFAVHWEPWWQMGPVVSSFPDTCEWMMRLCGRSPTQPSWYAHCHRRYMLHNKYGCTMFQMVNLAFKLISLFL